MRAKGADDDRVKEGVAVWRRMGRRANAETLFTWKVSLDGRRAGVVPCVDLLETNDGEPALLVARDGSRLTIRDGTGKAVGSATLQALVKAPRGAEASISYALWRPGTDQVLVFCGFRWRSGAESGQAVLLSSRCRVIRRLPPGIHPKAWSPDGRMLAASHLQDGREVSILWASEPFDSFRSVLDNADLARFYGREDAQFGYSVRLAWLPEGRGLLVSMDARWLVGFGGLPYRLWFASPDPAKRREALAEDAQILSAARRYAAVRVSGQVYVLSYAAP